MELGEGLTVDFGTRHHEATADVLLALDFFLVTHFDEFTEEFGDAFGVLFGADQVDLHAPARERFRVRG